MSGRRSYSDRQLRDAIRRATSWRGVLRELGLAATSAGAMRSVRAHADRLGVNYDHFTGQRRWTEAGFRSAVETAGSWPEVLTLLGLRDASATAVMKGHAARLGIDVTHLEAKPRARSLDQVRPSLRHLDRAGPLLAASWFTLSGQNVSWPLEPSRYDLLVGADQAIRRVQVKTTTVRTGDTWKVYLSISRRLRRTYDPDEIDDFFVIDGDLNCYLIPVVVVGGLHAIHVRSYAKFKLPRFSACERA